MRIDKFLWCIRMFPTRKMATEALRKNKVLQGEHPLKASKEVLIGDIISIKKNQITYKIQVIGIPKSRVGAKLVSLFIKDLTDPLEYEKLKLSRLSQQHYRQKGSGRPTKRERRDLDEFKDLFLFGNDEGVE